jgi:hypothetical protein
MSSQENLNLQLSDIEKKIERLDLQRRLLLDRIKRKEEHSARIMLQNENAERDREEQPRFNISTDARINDLK